MIDNYQLEKQNCHVVRDQSVFKKEPQFSNLEAALFKCGRAGVTKLVNLAMIFSFLKITEA